MLNCLVLFSQIMVVTILLSISMRLRFSSSKFTWDMQILSTCVGLILCDIRFSRCIYVSAKIHYFYKCCTYTLCFSYPSADGHLGYFLCFAIMNSTAIREYKCHFDRLIPLPLDACLVGGLLGHMVVFFLIFGGNFS